MVESVATPMKPWLSEITSMGGENKLLIQMENLLLQSLDATDAIKKRTNNVLALISYNVTLYTRKQNGSVFIFGGLYDYYST